MNKARLLLTLLLATLSLGLKGSELLDEVIQQEQVKAKQEHISSTVAEACCKHLSAMRGICALEGAATLLSCPAKVRVRLLKDGIVHPERRGNRTYLCAGSECFAQDELR
ncbi:MAG: hypothetical protein GDA55_06445 [Cellvibrionales bacterium]|nr:hypothetical protein [Cellvibrionales bacterium]